MTLESIPALAVKSTTGMATAAGVWTGVIVISITLLIAIIKIIPKLREIRVGEKQHDMARLEARIDTLEKSVKDANERAEKSEESAHQSEMSMVIVIAALQLVMGEVDKLDPGNKVLKQARDMVATARTGDLGMNQAITRLSTIRGIGEVA